MPAPTVVVGLGNPLMGDEGIGVEVLRRLMEVRDSFPGVDFLDLGTNQAALLHALPGRRKAVLVDCAFHGAAPGHLARFTPADVQDQKAQPRLTLHEGNILDTLALSRSLGECPGDIVIFGIEPQTVAWSDRLSPPLAARLDDYLRAVKEELSPTTAA